MGRGVNTPASAPVTLPVPIPIPTPVADFPWLAVADDMYFCEAVRGLDDVDAAADAAVDADVAVDVTTDAAAVGEVVPVPEIDPYVVVDDATVSATDASGVGIVTAIGEVTNDDAGTDTAAGLDGAGRSHCVRPVDVSA